MGDTLPNDNDERHRHKNDGQQISDRRREFR